MFNSFELVLKLDFAFSAGPIGFAGVVEQPAVGIVVGWAFPVVVSFRWLVAAFPSVTPSIASPAVRLLTARLGSFVG